MNNGGYPYQGGQNGYSNNGGYTYQAQTGSTNTNTNTAQSQQCITQLQTPIPVTTPIATWRQTNAVCLQASPSAQPVPDQCSTLRATWIVNEVLANQATYLPVQGMVGQIQGSASQAATEAQITGMQCTNGVPNTIGAASCSQLGRQWTLLTWYAQVAQSAIPQANLQEAISAFEAQAQATYCTLTTVV